MCDNVKASNIDIVTADPATDLSVRISVYPNPFSEEITVEATQSIINCRLVDLQGRQIQQFDFGMKQGTIATESLAQGVYVLIVTTASEEKRIRIIKK